MAKTLRNTKELRAEVERLQRLNARYRREAKHAHQRLEIVYGQGPGPTPSAAPLPLPPEEFPVQPWYRRAWSWLVG